jgi:acyl-CoA reductase-like NAD-dependent aldehyde dehydrogenase
LELANDTEYGLTSAIFIKGFKTGLRFARSIETGAVHINDLTVHDETPLPHVGVKASGFGRFGVTGSRELVRTETV